MPTDLDLDALERLCADPANCTDVQECCGNAVAIRSLPALINEVRRLRTLETAQPSLDLVIEDYSAREQAWKARAEAAEQERDALRARVERLEAAAHRLLSVVERPDNGANHCRWCSGGTNTGWEHDDYCVYAQRVAAIEKAREEARAALAPEPKPT